MGQLEFIDAFYKKQHDYTSLIEGIDSLLYSHDLKAYIVPIFATQDPMLILNNKISLKKKSVLIKQYENGGLFSLSFTIKERSNIKEISGKFFIYKFKDIDNIYLLFSLGESDFFIKGLYPFIKSLYPKFSLTFIKQDKLEYLLNYFKEINNYDSLIIKRCSSRRRISSDISPARVIPEVSWPDYSIEEAFQYINDNNGWFQNLEFKVKKSGAGVTTVSISREGVIRVDSAFSIIVNYLVAPICVLMNNNNVLFNNRERNKSNNFRVLPLAIKFEPDHFSNNNEKSHFIKALKLYNNAGVSILHGNPYVSASLLDYYDGSNFDIWILSDDKIIIIPQLKSSVPALKRLISHIFDTYSEGVLTDYKEEK